MCSIFNDPKWKYENDDVDINGLFEMKGFYINLDHRTDRKRHMENQLEQIRMTGNITRFNAIKNLNGRIGCSLSHLKCIQIAKEANWESVMILEDDILFLLPDELVENANNFFSNKKNKWDVLLLAGNNVPPFTTNADGLSIQVTHCQTTTGYIVKRHYYDVLISNIKEGITKLMREPEHHYYFAIDKYWLQLQKQDRWMLLIPIIVVQKPDYSDIEKRHTDYQRIMSSVDKAEFRK